VQTSGCARTRIKRPSMRSSRITRPTDRSGSTDKNKNRLTAQPRRLNNA
jgi:hypothetical protein